MAKDDEFTRSLRIPKLCLLLSGIKIDQPLQTAFFSFLKNYYLFIFNLIITGLCIPCEIGWCLSSKMGFVGLTYMMPCIVYGILGFVKIANILHKVDIISKLIKDLHGMFPGNSDYKESEDIDEEAESDIVIDSLKLSRKVVFVLFWTNLLLILLFDLRPLIVLAFKYFAHGQLELSLPMFMNYPFDPYDLRFWPIAYGHQCYSSACCIYNLIGPDTLFFVCCTHLYMQFRILKRRLEIFITGSEIGGELEVAKKFSILAKRHQKLIELVGRLERVYSTSIFLNYGCSSFLICFTGFNVTTLNDAWSVLNYLVFFSSNVSQIFLICLFGDLIMNSSREVADGIYNCKWYATTPKIRRSILFYLVRSQKPCKLTAINFADVNLISFTTILSRSWSYFALLRTVMSTRSQEQQTLAAIA
ncbi:unnamed protein product [Plutella xylostella]|uniref:Odorant receptor n=1 Tax=Plutella xylostella TaxID=51655 RepID=A0A8S4G684_PLUXY|nr:unnamed protein product [Plutella xylostella]